MAYLKIQAISTTLPPWMSKDAAYCGWERQTESYVITIIPAMSIACASTTHHKRDHRVHCCAYSIFV